MSTKHQPPADFPELVLFRAPPGFKAAMIELARREFCPSVSDLIRRSLLARFRDEGIAVNPDAGRE
jgi:hypothetical protein